MLHCEFLQRCGKICEYGSRYYAVSESNVYIILNKKIIFLEQYHNFFFKFSCKNSTELDLKILEQICIALEANKTAVLYPELRHNLFRLTDDYEKSIEYSKEDFQKTILSNYRNWICRKNQNTIKSLNSFKGKRFNNFIQVRYANAKFFFLHCFQI